MANPLREEADAFKAEIELLKIKYKSRGLAAESPEIRQLDEQISLLSEGGGLSKKITGLPEREPVISDHSTEEERRVAGQFNLVRETLRSYKSHSIDQFKSFFRAEADALLIKITQIKSKYESLLPYLRLGSGGASSAPQMPHLDALISSLKTGKIAIKINQLSDSSDEIRAGAIKAVSAMLESYLSECNKQEKSVERIEQSLSSSVLTMDEQLRRLIEKKSLFITMGEKLSDSKARSPDVPQAFSSDQKLTDHLQMISQHHGNIARLINHYTNKAQKNGDHKAQEKVYIEGISALEGYRTKTTHLYKAVLDRVEELNLAESEYNDVVTHRDGILPQTQMLLDGAELARAKVLDDGAKPSLKKLIEQIKKKIVDMTDKDYRTSVRLEQNDFLKKIKDASKLCESEIDSLEVMQDQLKDKFTSIEQAEEKRVQQGRVLVQLFDTQEEQFKHLYDQFSEQLGERSALMDPVNTKKELFNKELAAGKPAAMDRNKAESAENMLKKLAHLTKELKSTGLEQVKLMAQGIKASIRIQCKQVLEEVSTSGHNLEHSPERELIRTIKEFEAKATSPMASTSDELMAQLKQLKDGSVNLAQTIKSIRDVLEIHTLVKALINGTEVPLSELVNKIIENNALFNAVLARYDTRDQYLTFLNEHFETVISNPRGLEALKASITGKGGVQVDAIKNKLDFITVVSERIAGYKDFFNQPEVILAVLQLDQAKLEAHLSRELIERPNFCKALGVIRNNGITLTEPMLLKLKDSPDTCDVLCQQADLYQSTKSISEGEFKSLINDFLKTDNKVAQAVNAVFKHNPNYCQHGLLILVKDSPALKEMLCTEVTVNSNLPFLKHVFEEAAILGRISLSSYFDKSLPDVFNGLLERNKVIIQSIQNANHKPHEIHKLATIMEKFNVFCDQEKNNLPSILSFRKEVIPILLSDRNMEEKKTAIDTLAHEHFKQTGRLNIVLEFFFRVFEAISSSKAAQYRGTFFTPQKIGAQDISKELVPDSPPVSKNT